MICMLLSKRPGKIRDKWVRAVIDVRRKEHREGTLGDFIKLIHEETMLVDDPLFSKEAVDQYTDKKSSKQDNSKERISTFATNSKYVKKGCTNKRLIVYCMQQRPSFGFMQDLHGKDLDGKNQTLDQQKTMLWLLSTYDQY